MNNNEIKNINLLGHKRTTNNIIGNDEFKENEEEKTRENNQNKFSSKKPEFFHISIEEKNGNNLEGINGAQVTNINISTENKVEKKICQNCNTKDNLLLFNSIKSILDYLSRKNIFINKNNFLGEKINFFAPKIICLNCLLTISKNRTEFEKFIRANNNKKNDGIDNPFNNLLENPNLKNLSYFDIRKVRNNKQNELNEKNKDRENTEKILSQDTKPSPSINNETKNINNNNNKPNNNNNNNINTNNININNSNVNFDFLNTLNYSFLPLINYNMPFNQNIANLNIPNNFTNNLNYLFNINTSSKNSETKENNINKNNPLQPPLVNISDIFQNTLLNKPPSPFPQNNNEILNLSQLTLLNKNNQLEKNKKYANKAVTATNNINGTDNDKEKISKDDNEKLEQENYSKDYTLIKNQSFDEFFQIISNLYHRLLDIKINRDLYLDTKKILNKDNNQTLFSNNLNDFNNS